MAAQNMEKHLPSFVMYIQLIPSKVALVYCHTGHVALSYIFLGSCVVNTVLNCNLFVLYVLDEEWGCAVCISELFKSLLND